MKMVITLKNGNVVQADVQKVDKTTDSLTGGLTGLHWVHVPNPRSELFYINLADVSSIHILK